MRPTLLLLVLLLAPAAAGEPAPTVRQCTSNACVVIADQDGDGSYEWANLASVAGEQAALNVNANGSKTHVAALVTTEELGGHDLEDLLSAESHVSFAADARADGTRQTDALVVLSEADHETGESTTVAWRYVVLRDDDGDGVPETAETLP